MTVGQDILNRKKGKRFVLTKKLREHLEDNMIYTAGQLSAALEHQRAGGQFSRCFDCESAARRLGIELPPLKEATPMALKY